MLIAAKAAKTAISCLTTQEKNRALEAMADALETEQDAILSANKRIDRALIGAALSLNNNIDIKDQPGYAPLYNDRNLMNIVKESYEALVPDSVYPVFPNQITTGSTDMGDLSCIMPVVHPYIGGATGTDHGCDYQISDPELACVTNAKLHLMVLKKLLENDATEAKRVIAEAKPPFASKEDYLAYIDGLNRCGDRISYDGAEARVTLE